MRGPPGTRSDVHVDGVRDGAHPDRCEAVHHRSVPESVVAAAAPAPDFAAGDHCTGKTSARGHRHRVGHRRHRKGRAVVRGDRIVAQLSPAVRAPAIHLAAARRGAFLDGAGVGVARAYREHVAQARYRDRDRVVAVESVAELALDAGTPAREGAPRAPHAGEVLPHVEGQASVRPGSAAPGRSSSPGTAITRPSWPTSLLPQQETWPPCRAQVWLGPTATSSTVPGMGRVTNTGARRGTTVPSPTSPNSFVPQQ